MRLKGTVERVAQVEEAVDTAALGMCQYSIERPNIGVNIGEDGEAAVTWRLVALISVTERRRGG